MENQKSNEQLITLNNRKTLQITGVEKMLSVKPELIQIDTNFGTIQILGSNMEVSKLDLNAKILEVVGIVGSIKYLDDKKTPFFKRLFK